MDTNQIDSKVARIHLMLNYIQNMKLKYICFRIYFLLKSKLGILKLQFPKNPPFRFFLTKSEWIQKQIPFFKPGEFELNRDQKEELRIKVEKILNHTYTYFSSVEYDLKCRNTWNVNPKTNYQYDISLHWSQTNDFSQAAGDIKYVWEKARFTYLYDLIRYDYHFKEDLSEFVFRQIEDFIEKNPINQGPNYICSQEISLRILNWTFAIFHFQNRASLTEERLSKILNSIFWQLKHVYKAIYFSKIAVRNNHTIMETATLYLSGLLFPFFNSSKKWFMKGRKWLITELNYQIYTDGSYLQFSHNYHRVVIQILTWVLKLNQMHKISFDKIILKKIEATLDFLYQHQDDATGWLPNYGNNDGALFFPLNNHHFRDFRPQLQALGFLLGKKLYHERFEDTSWYGIEEVDGFMEKKKKVLSYEDGGFYGFRDTKSLTTIRCGAYKDRPSQADGLNVDIWYNGINIIRDPGTYNYNTKDKLIEFYFGTVGHSTLSIAKQSQMIKGNRFIWFYWTNQAKGKITEKKDSYLFEGELIGFPQFGRHIKHTRKTY